MPARCLAASKRRCGDVGRSAPRVSRFHRRAWVSGSLFWLLVVAGISLAWSLTRPKPPMPSPTKCVVVGLDGLDPNLTRQWMSEGLLPNLQRLANEGCFTPLATSFPPQSPVAWCSFATGMDPGGTGIFDFLDRDPKTYEPGESMSKVNPADPITIPLIGTRIDPILKLGSYRIPLRGQQIVLSRKGTPFWKYLDDADIPATVLRVPSNYPPSAGHTRQLTGMGTPDLTGSVGVYFFWTDRELTEAEHANARGRANIEVVRVENGRVIVPASADTGAEARPPRLIGPPNILKPDPQDAKDPNKRVEDWTPMTADLQISIDKQSNSVRIQLGDNDAILRPGDWTDWMPVTFTMAKWFWANPAGMVRFRLNSIEPFALYGTPINIDPLSPFFPITNPEGYSRELAESLGRFTTLGMPEDDKAIESKVRALDEAGFRKQCRDVLDDDWRTTRYELDRYKGGFLFTYFRTTDVMSHMLWYVMDPKHPAYDAQAAKLHSTAIQEGYRWVDEKVGEIRSRAGPDALFIVMSDHGFAPQYREFNLNGWLADNGWLTLRSDADRANAQIPGDVEWNATKAYALGLNTLYINTQGREAQGAVPVDERQMIAEQLCRELEHIVDPETGEQVVTHAYRREQVYSGAYVESAPDIIVGYNCHYACSGSSVQGSIRPPWEGEKDGKPVSTYARDNKRRWSGNHCCDPVSVPGVLLMNRPAARNNPALTDLAPTILQEFGIAKPSQMIGSPVVSPRKG